LPHCNWVDIRKLSSVGEVYSEKRKAEKLRPTTDLMENASWKGAWKGISFGLASGVITTLGMMVGIDATTNSKLAVLASILAIAIADSFSDSVGIHISEESEGKNPKEVWTATLFTLISKFTFAMSFTIPVLLLDLSEAIVASVLWGFALIAGFSYFNARQNRRNPAKEVAENTGIAMAVITVTYIAGKTLARLY